MTIFYAIRAAAILRGMWWWWGIPILMLIIIFTGLFLIAVGLDEIANPRLERSPGQMTVTLNGTNTDRKTTGDVTVLEVKNLRVHYATPSGDVIAVNGVDLKVFEGETIGLVGESGCGKSTLAMSILRLVQPPGRIVSGQVQIHGIDLIALSERELRQVRWNQIALIPQGAMNSLNPVMRVKNQIAEAIETHQVQRSPEELKERILRLLAMVGLPGRVYDMYPHELSGGMKQRVCIAMAIALTPSVVIADEPTSALDVVVQRGRRSDPAGCQKNIGASP
jgi:ABC-type glutathione transport system ATPase component